MGSAYLTTSGCNVIAYLDPLSRPPVHLHRIGKVQRTRDGSHGRRQRWSEGDVRRIRGVIHELHSSLVTLV